MGERYLGRISSAGTSVNNATTASPFAILPGSKLTVVASAAGRVLTDGETVSATPGVTFGVPVTANNVFPTSVGKGAYNIGGTQMTALIAFIPDSGAATLDVWQRTGQE